MVSSVVDLRKEALDSGTLFKAAAGENVNDAALKRFSREQVLAFARKVVIPIQVQLYNEYALAASTNSNAPDPWVPILFDDLRQTTVDAVVDPLLAQVARLFDEYEALQQGALYSFERGNSQWIARKEHPGFVAATLWSFPYAGIRTHFERAALQCVPDRHLYIPWDADKSNAYVDIGGNSTYFAGSQELGSLELKALLHQKHAKWQEEHPLACSQEILEEIATFQKKGQFHFTLAQINEARGTNYASWDDMHKGELSQIATRRTFTIGKSRAACEGIGFIPADSLLHTVHELYMFAIKFLGGVAPGVPFSEEAYETMTR